MINADIYDFIGNNLFYFNPLRPSGEPSQWIKELANIMAETVGGGFYAGGAFRVYIDIMDSLYRDYGVYDGSTNYPTMFDLLKGLEDFSHLIVIKTLYMSIECYPPLLKVPYSCNFCWRSSIIYPAPSELLFSH